MYSKDIQLQTVEPPRKFTDVSPVFLSDATVLERKIKYWRE